MADDQFQRPYRASEPPVRGPAKSTGNDPLAELARLIGQTDPFGEFSREAARRPAAPPSEERSDWNTQPAWERAYAPQAAPDPRARRVAATIRAAMVITPRALRHLNNSRTRPQSELVFKGMGARPYGDVHATGRRGCSIRPTTRLAAIAPGQADYPQDAYEHETSLSRPTKNTTMMYHRPGGAWALWRSPACLRWRWSAPPVPSAIARCLVRPVLPNRRRSSRPMRAKQDCACDSGQRCAIEQADYRSGERTRSERKAGFARGATDRQADDRCLVASRSAVADGQRRDRKRAEEDPHDRDPSRSTVG